jgi:hypothetical protein
MEPTWTKEWPIAEGRYWFYGWPYGDKTREPELNFVQVITLGAGKNACITYVRNGHFFYKSEGGEGMFAPMVVPKKFPKLT